jgi:hypothetical protein
MRPRRLLTRPRITGPTNRLLEEVSCNVNGEMIESVGDHPLLVGLVGIEPHAQRLVGEAVTATVRGASNVDACLGPLSLHPQLSDHGHRLTCGRDLERERVLNPCCGAALANLDLKTVE